MCVCCLCVLTSLDLRDRRSSVSMSVTSALKSSAVFMASTWWPRNCQIQTLDFGWIANGYWNELHSSTPGLLVRFSAIIQHPEAFIQFQHSYLQMQNTWCLETIYTVVSRSNEECWKPSKPLSRFHTVCPSRKTRTRSSALQNSSLPAARSWVFDKWIKMWLPNAVHERESPEKENRLAWSSTVSLVSSHLRLKKYSFFSAWRDHLTICCMLWKKLSLPWLFWHNLGRSSACPRCTHPPRIPGFCITTTSVQVRTSLQKHVSLKLQPQIWKKI